jgi:hypothetical protein
MISLVGVPGRSSLEFDAMLACREGAKFWGNMDVVDDGVALPVGGISVLGVGTSLKVFGAFLASGDWTAAGLLVDSGGKAIGAIADLGVVSGATAGLEAGLEGTEMFRIPARFSFAFVVLGAAGALLVEVTADFLTVAATGIALVGAVVLVSAGIVVDLALLFSRAGKSSF